jgi:glutathione S-transferase
MLTLYFSPGACSMASHIGIEETGAPYVEKPTLLTKGEQKTEAYLKINPRGKVPALSVDGRVITENTAILTYLARQFPQANLLPADPVGEAHCIGAMAWFSNVVHPSYQRHLRPERFAESEAAQATVKDLGRKSYWANCEEIDALLAGKQWMMGSQYTVVDPYGLVFYAWGLRGEFPMSKLTAYTAWKDRMLKRPAVMKILQSEQSVLLKAA